MHRRSFISGYFSGNANDFFFFFFSSSDECKHFLERKQSTTRVSRDIRQTGACSRRTTRTNSFRFLSFDTRYALEEEGKRINEVKTRTPDRIPFEFNESISRLAILHGQTRGKWSLEVEVGDKLGEIKRREREFNFGTGEWQQGSLLFSIIPEIEGEIRSRSPGYEIDCCSASVKSGGNQRHSDSPTFCVRRPPCRPGSSEIKIRNSSQRWKFN